MGFIQLNETEKILIVQKLPGLNWMDCTSGGLRACICGDLTIEIIREGNDYYFVEFISGEPLTWACDAQLEKAVERGYEGFLEHYRQVIKAIEKASCPSTQTSTT